jgi:hypothetical protein
VRRVGQQEDQVAAAGHPDHDPHFAIGLKELDLSEAPSMVA